MRAGLLCKQDLLRDIAKKHGATGAAVGEVRFRSTKRRDLACNSCSGSAASRRDRIARCLQRRVDRAFAAAARAHLHSSHLIRRA